MSPRSILPGLLAFEWRYQTRRIGFAAAALALAGFALVMVRTGYPPKLAFVNAPAAVMQQLGLLSLFAVFAMTVFCAEAALRDVEHGMTEIVFATPVGKRRHLLGRFGGALLAGTAAMGVAALALMLGPLVLPLEPERLGAVRPLAYGWALLVIVVPNLLLTGALLFAVAALTRSTLATYVGGVAIYALYWVSALLVESPLMAGAAPTPEGLARAALLDPFGLSAFFEQTRYWLPAERGTRMVALTGRLLLNRLLWLGVATAVLAFAYRRFEVRLELRRAAGTPRPATRGMPAEAPPSAVYRPVASSAAGVRGWWPVFGATLRRELRHVLRGWSFLALLTLWVFVAGMESVGQLGGGEYGTRVLPTTALLLDAILTPLQLLGTLVVVYYAAEVAWRERAVGVAPLVDATPAPSALLYLAKAAALVALPVVMALAGAAVALLVQLAHGATGVGPLLPLSLLWFGAAPLALFAVGALALQAAAGDRWTGLFGGLALAIVAQRGEMLGLEHPMLRFGAAPPAPYSEMDGFGGAAPSFAAFMLYWGAAAALLACVSWGLWRRGADAGLGARLAALPRRWGRAGMRVAAACAVAFALAGAALFRETTVVHAWEGGDARARWSADYERAWRHVAGRPQPSVTAARTTVDLYPAERRARITGALTLENRAPRAIDTVWVVTPLGAEDASADIPGARLVRRDARFGVHVFRMARPLAPGERAELRFAHTLDRGGIRADGAEHDVTPNGSYLTTAGAWPSLGYRPGRELDDPAERRRQGLAARGFERPPLAATDSVRAAGGRPGWLTLDATVSTDAGQTALAPGRLVREWATPGRRHFRYVAERPVTPTFGVVSAKYVVRRLRRGGVDVEVWHHPSHAANVERILAAAARSLDVMGARWGAYPHAVLRIAEVPSWSNFGGFALPGLILFTEDRGFLADPRDGDVDLVTRRVAHEVAHQWWGHVLDPLDVAGATTLVETLAKHGEQLVVASLHGEAALPPMLAFDEDRYLAGRADDAEGEPTLLEAEGQPWLYYGKGAVVMHALRAELGAGAVDRALARLVARHGGPEGGATTLDLRDALLAEARTHAARARVHEWLGGRVTYDLRVDTAAARALPGGRWRLDVRVAAAKLARRGGEEMRTAMEDEEIDVAVYDGAQGTGRALHAARVRVVDGRADFALELPAQPAVVVVDPFVRRIDRDRSDNRLRVTEDARELRPRASPSAPPGPGAPAPS